MDEFLKEITTLTRQAVYYRELQAVLNSYLKKTKNRHVYFDAYWNVAENNKRVFQTDSYIEAVIWAWTV